MAMSGSFNPCPVSTHTTVAPSGTPSRNAPATDAADAGSQNTDSSSARMRYAARISSSVTALMLPPLSLAAAVAPYHDAGFPIRIAVATVSGDSIGCPSTIGAAPAAWKPSIFGSLVARPAS